MMETILSTAAALACLLLPGLACLVWLDQRDRTFWEFLADAVGLSISLTALLALLFYLIRVPPGGWGIAIYLGVSVLSIAAYALSRPLPHLSRAGIGAFLAGLAGLSGLLALRFYQAKDLVFPNWVDSVHHTLIVRKIIEYGGLPFDLRPYLDVQLSYHYGFHITTALFAALAGTSPDKAVLWLGQVISACVALSIYRFARSLGQGQRAAFTAALVSGLVLYMPGYYLSWGRYTLLTGMVVLPLAMAAVQDLLRQPGDWRAAARVVLFTAGLCLTHYLALLVFLFYLALVGLEGLVHAARVRRWRALPLQAAGACLLGAVLASPWLVNMLILNTASIGIGEPKLVLKPGDFGGLVSLLRPDYDLMLMALAAACLLLAFFQPGLRQFSLWGLIIVFFSMPFAPQPGPFRADLFIILLFFPASVLLGWGMAGGANGLARLFLRRATESSSLRTLWSGVILALCAAPLLYLGVTQSRQLINPSTRIAVAADRAALEWVQTQTPADARFYINSTLWMTGAYRGVDGGYWLTSFAGRGSLVPPVFYTMLPADQIAQINDWAARSAQITGCTPEFWALVREARLTHVYVREKVGSLQPAALDQCPRLKPVYRASGVVIYQILNP